MEAVSNEAAVESVEIRARVRPPLYQVRRGARRIALGGTLEGMMDTLRETGGRGAVLEWLVRDTSADGTVTARFVELARVSGSGRPGEPSEARPTDDVASLMDTTHDTLPVEWDRESA
jgi:hypothetical protein